ncbi:MAG: VOC family protein [Candidatus Promineifilaceae bacterium]
MTVNENLEATRNYSIHPSTRLGIVSLTVGDLDHQLEFYLKVLGLQLHWREGAKAGLGAGREDLLHLVEMPGARRVRGTTGLYHFALLLPSRRELARAIARLFQLRYPNYPTDHVVSKTTYLDDAEGNNIELYIYSEEDGTFAFENGRLVVRHADGRLSDGREPLDVEALFRELSPEDNLDKPLPADTMMGHVHLYGANLDESMRFYSDVLGFKEGVLVPDFRFADVELDRPHVIAFNTWQGEGARPQPPDSLGLRHFTIVLPNREELDKVLARVREAGIATERTEDGILVRDPAQIGLLLTMPKTG